MLLVCQGQRQPSSLQNSLWGQRYLQRCKVQPAKVQVLCLTIKRLASVPASEYNHVWTDWSDRMSISDASRHACAHQGCPGHVSTSQSDTVVHGGLVVFAWDCLRWKRTRGWWWGGVRHCIPLNFKNLTLVLFGIHAAPASEHQKIVPRTHNGVPISEKQLYIPQSRPIQQGVPRSGGSAMSLQSRPIQQGVPRSGGSAMSPQSRRIQQGVPRSGGSAMSPQSRPIQLFGIQDTDVAFIALGEKAAAIGQVQLLVVNVHAESTVNNQVSPLN